MVDEDAAVGRVAAVYAAASERAPFVPSLLKSLAVCPPYLTLAWEQLGPALEEPALTDAADRLAATIERAPTPPADPRDRRLLADFVGPVGTMLLASCGLLAALDGALRGWPAATGAVPPPPARPLAASVPATRQLVAQAAMLGRIRAALDTPILNSVWRKAAVEGRVEAVWHHLEPQAASTRGDADQVAERARAEARELPWQVVADPAALKRQASPTPRPGCAPSSRRTRRSFRASSSSSPHRPMATPSDSRSAAGRAPGRGDGGRQSTAVSRSSRPGARRRGGRP
jgi:hypothetical protein